MAYRRVESRVEERVEREREYRECRIEHTHAKFGLRLRFCMGCAIYHAHDLCFLMN